MKIKISYPSGKTLHIEGIWKGPGNIKGEGIILIESKGMIVCDIRGVYQNEETNEVLYNPRFCMDGMDKWAVDWLKEHPEWPG